MYVLVKLCCIFTELRIVGWVLRFLDSYGHRSNSWEFKSLQQFSHQYLLSTFAYQNWLLICYAANKWPMSRSVYMKMSGGQTYLFWQDSLVHFFSQKKGTNQAYQNNSFHHDTNFLISLERTCCFQKQERSL